MLFTSGIFLFLFLPATLVGFFLIARFVSHRAAAAWLVFASLVFYGYWHPPHVPLLIASILFNYWAGERILRAKNDGAAARRILISAVSVNLLVLGYFKYADFLAGTVNALFDLRLHLPGVKLPIGISFFTFTQIAYLVDVYVGKVRERQPIHYALFVTYFPHLIAGPVLHHAEMMPQFGQTKNYSPRLRDFTVGLTFLAVGLAKKVLIADSVAPVANALFDTARTNLVPATLALQGVLAYSLQIYFDFSGYSDMAVGLSRLMGVELPYNFNSPYKSRSIIEFWRRWHMTLSRFLRDYLYLPLGGNRHGSARRYSNLMVTMLLGGLWHGASWTFVLWGGLHGLYLIANHGWRFLRERILRTVSPLLISSRIPVIFGRLVAQVMTLTCVAFAWILFRADTAQSAGRVVQSIVGHAGSAGNTTRDPWSSTTLWLVAALALSLLAKNSQELIDGKLRPVLLRGASVRLDRMCSMLIGFEIVMIVLLALISASRNVTEFIYFNF
jgi:alginate O-acetyltransferase complex protein AlgI